MPSFRTVPRYFLQPPMHARFGEHEVSLVDLSLKGVRMESAQQFPLGTTFSLTIETLSSNITVPATVLWSAIDELSLSDGPDRYVVGLTFEEQSDAIGVLIETLLRLHLAVPIEDARTADRFTISAPLAGSFGDMAPVALMDLSIRGARIATSRFIPFGTTAALRFQVDGETGPVNVVATVAWCLGVTESGFEAGLKVEGNEELLRLAIHRLCMRDEARIDMHSLRRRFESMRALSHEYTQVLAAS